MKIMTVRGPVDCEELGITLPHEHLLMSFDWPGLWPDVSHRPDLVWKKLSMEDLGEVRRNYCVIRDNCLLYNIGEICDEVDLFKKAGGGAIIEVSTYGLARDIIGLKEISTRTGVHIIAGTGYYLSDSLSATEKQMTAGQLYEVIMRDITDGFPGTGIHAGIIGEVAVSYPLVGVEKQSLIAAARAQRDSGLALNIHIGSKKELSRQVIDVLKEEKADLCKVSFAHFDGPAPLENYTDVAKEGIYIEIDCFGYEFYVDNGAYDSDFPSVFQSDATRVQTVKMLINAGLGNRILLSQDVAYKSQTVRYGGNGYAHILENVSLMFESAGITKQEIIMMMKKNVCNYLNGK